MMSSSSILINRWDHPEVDVLLGKTMDFDFGVNIKSRRELNAAVAGVLRPFRGFLLGVVQEFIEAPQSSKDFAIGPNFSHYSLAAALLPVSLENETLLIVETAKSMHLVVQKIAIVYLPVGPNHASFAALLIVHPWSFVGLLFFPTVLSLTLQLIVHEFSLVVASVLELELTKAVLLALASHTVVHFAVSEDLASFSLLLAVQPAAAVDRSIIGIVLSLSKC